MEKPIKILTFTPVWRRPEVFEICLAGLKRMQDYAPDRFKIIPFFIVSEAEAAMQVEKYGFDFIYWQNRPLGAKKNAGLKYVMNNFEFDYLMEFGSDDISTNEYLHIVEPEMLAGVPEITPSSVWFIDSRNGAVSYWKTKITLGLGRCISHKALKLFAPDYQLWLHDHNSGMDTCSMHALTKKGIDNKLILVQDCHTLDIKSDENINSIDHFQRVSLTAQEMCANFPEGHMILKLIEQTRIKEESRWKRVPAPPEFSMMGIKQI